MKTSSIECGLLCQAKKTAAQKAAVRKAAAARKGRAHQKAVKDKGSDSGSEDAPPPTDPSAPSTLAVAVRGVKRPAPPAFSGTLKCPVCGRDSEELSSCCNV